MKSNIYAFIKWITAELGEIKNRLDAPDRIPISSEWVKWKIVAEFFDYKDTQMAEFAVEAKLVVTKIGRRKFILKKSILELLENNIISPDTTDRINESPKEFFASPLAS